MANRKKKKDVQGQGRKQRRAEKGSRLVVMSDGLWLQMAHGSWCGLGGLGHEGERVTWALVGLEQRLGTRMPAAVYQRV